jgi:hypothetical protein
MSIWKPIETAPKDGTLILIRDEPDSCTPCFWDGRRWRLWTYEEHAVDAIIAEWAPYPE